MKICNNILEAVGQTPLVRINKLSDANSASVFGKVEFMNPGGAIKDRMAIYMIECAEKECRLKPGGTIIEGTSGNTGFALAMVAAVKGYRCIFTIPDKMSLEKINMMKGMGAEVIVTPTDVPHESPENYCEVAKRLARETPNSLYVDQFNQASNIQAHYETTGPEIWEQTEGRVDCFVASAGTGGTISGVGRFLKEKAKESGQEIKIVCADPEGSLYYDFYYNWEPSKPRVYKVEGIGNDARVDALDFSVIDEMMRVSDRDSFLTARRLAREEGIFAGGSAGLNLFAALELAKEFGPGKNIVTVFPDSGQRYISKQYNDEWMKDVGFLDLDARLGTVRDLLQFLSTGVECASPDEPVSQVVERMSSLGISQMPIMGSDSSSHLMVHELDLLKSLVSGMSEGSDPVKNIATRLEGQVKPEDPISLLEQIFSNGEVAVVLEGNNITGIITKIDVVKYLTSRK